MSDTVDISASQIQEMVQAGYLRLAVRNGKVVYVLSEKGETEAAALLRRRKGEAA